MFKTRTLGSAALALALAVTATAGQAAVIDFNAHAVDYGTPIFDSGFTFNVSASGWGVFKASDGPCCNVNDNGTRALFASGNSSGPANIVMTQTGGGTFSLFGLDSAVYQVGAAPGTVTLTGNVFGGGVVSTVLNIDGSWDHYALSGFTNLTNLTFAADSGSFLTVGFGIDNLDLTGAPAVPEASTWAMMIIGFGMAGAALRRRQSTAVSFA